MPLTENYSYSKLATYEQCPFKFWLKYVENHSVFSGSIAKEFGSAIHKHEESIFNDIKNNNVIHYDDYRKILLDTVAQISKKYSKDFYSPDKSGKTYKEKIEFYINNNIDHKLENFHKAYPNVEFLGAEVRFNFEEEFNKKKRKFNGSIDRLFYDNEKDIYLIQDIKSWPVPAEKSDLKMPMQFIMYILGLQHLKPKGKDVRLDQIYCQYDLPLVDLTQDVINYDKFDENFKSMTNLLTRIDSKDFHPIPTALCHWCEYCDHNPSVPKDGRHLCAYYSNWQKKGDNVKSVVHSWNGIMNNQKINEEYRAAYKQFFGED